MTDREVLEMFMNYDLSSAKDVFDKFMTLDNAQYYEYQGRPSCVYIPGSRPDRVLLVAHADTVFGLRGEHRIIHDKDKDIYKSGEADEGIGADDRAGCAILWLLKDSGHSLLVTNDEELGSLGSRNIRDFHKKLFEELNGHSYALEFDRRHGNDYKFYNIPVTEEFKKFIEDNTGYREADKKSSTDIRILCEKICGANLSVGYHYEHTPLEYLKFHEWQNTLNVARKMLEPEQKRFSIQPANEVTDEKLRLRNIFYDTAAFCREEAVLIEAVKFSLANTEVYRKDDYPDLPVIPDKACTVSVTKERTFESAMRLHREAQDKKIAVLNFAAATRPGGGVKNG
ncbi:MAG: DUF2263 domain-containing protein, partial [Synergistaceae bacterium]|nr:DUF2263 domain-containing protein [Synergistaceae bacterium]